MWRTTAARGAHVSQLASNGLSKGCSKGTTASRWLLSPLLLFQRGTVVPCCGKMSKKATELVKTIINIWQSFLNVQGNCLVELKRREDGKRVEKMRGEKASFWLQFREGINKIWVKSHGPLMPSIIWRTVDSLPLSWHPELSKHTSLQHAEMLSAKENSSPTLKKRGNKRRRESELEIGIGEAGDEKEIILQILFIWFSCVYPKSSVVYIFGKPTLNAGDCRLCFFPLYLKLKLFVNIFHFQKTIPYQYIP